MASSSTTAHRNPLVPPPLRAELRGAVRAALGRRSACVPDGAVLLSMVDEVQAPLRPLQFARVRAVELDCLTARLVSLCWNHSDAHGACVQAPRAVLDLLRPGAAEPEVLYHLKCWSKWALLHAALEEARVALYVDADVLLLRNPFAAPAVGRFAASSRCAAADAAAAAAAAAARGPALMYQWEGAGSNPLNSGQLLGCSAAAARHALAAMPPALSAGRLPEGGARLDQEYAYGALEGGAHPIERLPRPAFAGNCWFGPPENPPWCDVFLFHAHCTPPGVAAKRARMLEVLRETRAACADAAPAAAPPRAARWGRTNGSRGARTRRRVTRT